MVYHKSALASASARETDQQHTHLGDDPHPERRFTPASKGQGRSAGDDHRSQQPKASSDRNRGNAIPGGGQASGADGHGNHTTDNVSWANWWPHKSTYGVDEILKMVRDRFNKSTEGGLKQYSNSEGLGAATQQLPRLPLYDSILHGPSVDRQLEYHILSELNYLLRLAQAHVKALGVEPFELKDVHTVPDTHMLPGQGPTVQGPAVLSLSEKALYHLIRLSPLKGYMSPLVDTSSTARSLKGYTTTPVDTSSCPRSVAQPVALLSKEEEKKQLVEVLHKLTAIVRRGLSLSVQSSHASPEFAARANMFMDCLDKNFEVVLLHKGHCFSLTGLIAKLAIPESVNTVTGEVAFYANALQKVLTVAECVVKNIGTCPGPFDKIGREAQKILNDDFPFGKLKLNTLGNDTAAFAFGAQGTPDEASELFMIKTKEKNQSVYFSAKPSGLAANVNGNAANVNGNAANGNVNAANGNGIVAVQNDAYFTKLSMDKLYGENIKCVLKLPFPSLNVKLVRKVPYYALAGDVALRPANGHHYPKLNLSCTGGVQYIGLGYQFSLDTQQMLCKISLGIIIRTDLAAASLMLKQGGTYKAAICKKFIDSTTTVAGQASFSSEAGEDHGFKCTVGLKRSIDPELHVKARVGTEGVSVTVKKSWNAGLCMLKACAHMDFNENWLCPKYGVVFSCGS